MSILNLLQAIHTARKAESFSPQQIHDLQQKRFKNLLRHVLQKSRFYQRYYHEHGIKEHDIDGIKPEELPVIDKQIMMDNYDDFVCDSVLKKSDLEQFINESPDAGSLYKGVYRIIHTSGSSGTVGLFVYGQRDWSRAKALGLRVTGIKVNPFKREKLAFIGATDGHYASITSVRNAPRLLFKVMSLFISSPLEQICRDIVHFKPDFLVGYASGINFIAQAQITGKIRITPKRIFCTGDPLTPVIRSSIEEAFGVNPKNLYGTSETMTLGAECNLCHRLHLFEDWIRMEVVDNDLKPVRSGQTGKVIITNLYNYTQPLIRYQMNDEIVLSDKPCQCGWPFPVIEKIAGRHEEFLWFTMTDGSKEFIHPLVLVDFRVPGLDKFQFVQTAQNKLILKAVVHCEKGNIVTTIHKTMNKILTKKSLEDTIQFDVEFVDEIKNDPKTGKFRLIIPFEK